MITRRLSTARIWRVLIASGGDSFSIGDSATHGAQAFTRTSADSFAISDATHTGVRASDSIGAISDSA